MPEHISYKMACWNASPRKAEKEEMENMLASVDDMRILIMNVEAFSTEKGQQFAKMFLRITESFMAIDESTTIKNHRLSCDQKPVGFVLPMRFSGRGMPESHQLLHVSSTVCGPRRAQDADPHL